MRIEKPVDYAWMLNNLKYLQVNQLEKIVQTAATLKSTIYPTVIGQSVNTDRVKVPPPVNDVLSSRVHQLEHRVRILSDRLRSNENNVRRNSYWLREVENEVRAKYSILRRRVAVVFDSLFKYCKNCSSVIKNAQFSTHKCGESSKASVKLPPVTTVKDYEEAIEHLPTNHKAPKTLQAEEPKKVVVTGETAVIGDEDVRVEIPVEVPFLGATKGKKTKKRSKKSSTTSDTKVQSMSTDQLLQNLILSQSTIKNSLEKLVQVMVGQKLEEKQN